MQIKHFPFIVVTPDYHYFDCVTEIIFALTGERVKYYEVTEEKKGDKELFPLYSAIIYKGKKPTIEEAQEMKQIELLNDF